MKSQSKSSLVPSFRCSHRTATGRQCRQISGNPQSGLCPHHLDELKQSESSDLSAALLARSENFQTAQGVNFALANIYRLLAANRISPRRASVLAYLNSLLLRTLPAIDADNEAGITCPTAQEAIQAEPLPPSVFSPTPQAKSDSNAQASETDTNTDSDFPDSGSPEMKAKPSPPSPSDASATHDPAPPSKYRSYWATIPDPSKKPS